ncbi:MAG: hypothetical protein COB02_09480 [Candidatus Cloacimonadota bacterium]|nr:MAG: hypothetical protein COB02_09480 [Candidatus Cloacimonadota bacterium]
MFTILLIAVIVLILVSFQNKQQMKRLEQYLAPDKPSDLVLSSKLYSLNDILINYGFSVGIGSGPFSPIVDYLCYSYDVESNPFQKILLTIDKNDNSLSNFTSLSSCSEVYKHYNILTLDFKSIEIEIENLIINVGIENRIEYSTSKKGQIDITEEEIPHVFIFIGKLTLKKIEKILEINPKKLLDLIMLKLKLQTGEKV